MISVRYLSKKYDHPVLIDINHDFPSGSVTFLMGANGSGKTTFFKCLMGLESHSGTVTFDGKRLADVRSQVVPVFDDTPFYPHLTGHQNLELLLAQRVPRQAARDAWSLGTDVEVPLDRPVKGYSSGQRKRLALCLGLLAEARYLVMDELASGLDLVSMDAVVAAIRAMSPDATVVVSGHQFDFYARIIDHVAVLRDGALRTVELDDISADALESTYRRLLACRTD